MKGAAKRGGANVAAIAKAAAAVAAIALLAAVGARAGPAVSQPASSPVAMASSPAAASASGVPDAASMPSAPSLPAQGSGTEVSAHLGDGRVVLNAAGEDELVGLPGIGHKRAQSILALRQRLGRFRSFSELLRVKGLGRKTLERLRPRLVLDAPSAGAEGPSGQGARSSHEGA